MVMHDTENEPCPMSHTESIHISNCCTPPNGMHRLIVHPGNHESNRNGACTSTAIVVLSSVASSTTVQECDTTKISTHTPTDSSNCSSPHQYDDGAVLPQHIQAFLEADFIVTAAVRLKINKVVPLRSAQQQMYLVHLDVVVVVTPEANVDLPSRHTEHFSYPTNPSSEPQQMRLDALRRGNNYVVIKIWTGTSRWWNCSHIDAHTTMNGSNTLSDRKEGSSSTTNNGDNLDDKSHRQREEHQIAQQEIFGYECADTIFTHIQNSTVATTNDKIDSNDSCIPNNFTIPKILYSSITTTSINGDDDHTDSTVKQPPWCIMEYVGPYSSYFRQHPLYRTFDTTYLDSMIPTRIEYGYDEPHLRWGRLPIHSCLPYTIQLLQTFVVPLHRYYYKNVHQNNPSHAHGQLPTAQMNVYYFETMLKILITKYAVYIEPNVSRVVELDSASHPAVATTVLKSASHMLKMAINTLNKDGNVSSITNLSPVLCHMDLQPQNIIFATSSASASTPSTTTEHSCCHILSILDWEEATYADARFELLLICRKVCANREQADYIWQYYEEQINESIDWKEQKLQLGSIVPWLKLEAIHSITSMLLECVAYGGRGCDIQHSSSTTISNPSQNDINLYQKIQREFQRLYSLGVTCCNTDHWYVPGEQSTSINT
jgi:Choline/ethanolamine kinase